MDLLKYHMPGLCPCTLVEPGFHILFFSGCFAIPGCSAEGGFRSVGGVRGTRDMQMRWVRDIIMTGD